jgi:hypothetical protein
VVARTAVVACLLALVCGAPIASADVATLSFGPVQDWTNGTTLGGPNVKAISCPGPDFCAASGPNATVATSTTPTAGPWTPTNIDGGAGTHNAGRLVCPSTTLCTAINPSTSLVFTSTNALGGSATWTATNLAGLTTTDLACPSATLCVVVDRFASIATSANPTGGPATWTKTSLAAAVDHLSSVACASTTFCVAFGIKGSSTTISTTTDPTGGASAWTTKDFGTSLRPLSASCATASLCATTDGGSIYTSDNPAGGAAAWTTVTPPEANLFAVSCPSPKLCVAVGWPHVYVSIDPNGGASQWETIDAPAGFHPLSVSCPNTALCLIGGVEGLIATTVTVSSGTPSGLPSGPGPDGGNTGGSGGTSAPHKPVVALGSRALTVTRAGSARVLVDCRKSSVACAGKAALAAKVTSRHKLRTVALGSHAFKIAAGKRSTVAIALSHTARSLLSSHHGTLHASLRLTLTGGRVGAALAVTLKVGR